jgi:hypothetical protein
LNWTALAVSLLSALMLLHRENEAGFGKIYCNTPPYRNSAISGSDSRRETKLPGSVFLPVAACQLNTCIFT